MKTSTLGHFHFNFDYNQFLVYDVSVDVPECEWTEQHCSQGCARRESAACLATLFESGRADATVFFGPYTEQNAYERVVALPFYSPTGKVVIRGLMELYLAHLLFCEPGQYRLYVAQWVVDDNNECQGIHLFFEPRKEAVAKSQIITADEVLRPPPVLLESASELRG